ncbi:MAG: ImmA/IrrE family metallo-endopeptidase [Conexibacter sp.]
MTEPPVPEQAIEYLPRVRVRYRLARELSGSVAWQDGAWQIVVNADDAWVRQRFSLAHELKHALDAPLADTLYGPRFDGDAARIAEQAADYFAACFLMPRAMLKRTFYDQGIRHERALARVFDVSVAAMRVRLDALKLHEPARVAA